MRILLRAVGVALFVTVAAIAFHGVSAQPFADEFLKPLGPGALLSSAVDDFFGKLDGNKDGKLQADELTEHLRSAFRHMDLNQDGYIGRGELLHALSEDSRHEMGQGSVISDHVIAVVDDFIVDVYHNGNRVPDSKRTLLNEISGATVERIDIPMRKGDWLVFNVVNNRLRWGGAHYFAVAGLKEGAATAFTTELSTGCWTRCDDPSQAAAFISDPQFLDNQPANGIETPWDQGNTLMNQYADGWKGTPIWGESRNTWIRFVAR